MLRGILLVTFLAGIPAAGNAQAVYHFTQVQGSVGFAVWVLGIFHAGGKFERFAGTLLLDPAHPETSRVDVDLDTASIDLSLPDGASRLRSPLYFDTARFPQAGFHSTAVVPLAPNRFRIDGALTLRGMTHPLALVATLVNRHSDAATHSEVADLVADGMVSRESFGMMADLGVVSDSVSLSITMRLALPQAPPPVE